MSARSYPDDEILCFDRVLIRADGEDEIRQSGIAVHVVDIVVRSGAGDAGNVVGNRRRGPDHGDGLRHHVEVLRLRETAEAEGGHCKLSVHGLGQRLVRRHWSAVRRVHLHGQHKEKNPQRRR